MLKINGKEEVEDPGVRKPILEGLVVERECDRERLKIYFIIKKETRSFRVQTTKTKTSLFFLFLNTFFLEMLPLASGGGLDTPVHVVQ